LPEYMVPSPIVIVDRFPLTPNGKVDRKALPAPARSAPAAESAPPVSRDALDLQLIRLWEKILGVRPIGLRDNFFDLGGNSLVAVRLFSEMRKVLGRSFPLAVLLQAPTVEKLADVVRKDGWSSSWTSLVPIQPGGSKPPFFCVHGGGGNVLLFQQVANRLAPDYPFYGLQARGLDGSTNYLKSIEEMAGCYLKEIRDLQPNGPYFLGGFCMGGQVALEMAQMLLKEGEKVALLAMIDTYNFNGVFYRPSVREKVANAGKKFAFHSLNIMRLGLKEQVAYVNAKAKNTLHRELARFHVWASNLFNIRLSHNGNGAGGADKSLDRINEDLHFAYIAKPYPKKITMFNPRRNYSFVRDPQMGWGQIGVGGIELIELPADPGGIFIEPYVQTLAQKLKEQIDRAVSPGAEIPVAVADGRGLAGE